MMTLTEMVKQKAYEKKSGKMSLMQKAAMMADKNYHPYTLGSVAKALKWMVTGKD